MRLLRRRGLEADTIEAIGDFLLKEKEESGKWKQEDGEWKAGVDVWKARVDDKLGILVGDRTRRVLDCEDINIRELETLVTSVLCPTKQRLWGKCRSELAGALHTQGKAALYEKIMKDRIIDVTDDGTISSHSPAEMRKNLKKATTKLIEMNNYLEASALDEKIYKQNQLDIVFKFLSYIGSATDDAVLNEPGGLGISMVMARKSWKIVGNGLFVTCNLTVTKAPITGTVSRLSK